MVRIVLKYDDVALTFTAQLLHLPAGRGGFATLSGMGPYVRSSNVSVVLLKLLVSVTHGTGLLFMSANDGHFACGYLGPAFE